MSINYKGYEYFYVNGSSHTKGGGFETTNAAWTWEFMGPYYKEHYNVEWNTCEDVNWGTRLSEIIGIPCHNHAMQGGGLDRAIRKTYEFIEDNWDNKHKFFIILETPDESRTDVYYNPWKEFFLMNDSQESGFHHATTNYFPEPSNIDDVQEDFKWYYEKFHNRKEHFKANNRNLAGLYSFCKRVGIPIKIMQRDWSYYTEYYDKTDIISSSDNSLNLIDFCIQNKRQIKHETNFTVIDGHPGYFAHIEYAKLIKEWLEINLINNVQVVNMENDKQKEKTNKKLLWENQFKKSLKELSERDPFIYGKN